MILFQCPYWLVVHKELKSIHACLKLVSSVCCRFEGPNHSVVPRPSPAPDFDRLQYAKTEGEGLGTYITSTRYLFLETRVGYRVGQGFVSRNASRNTRGRVQGEVQLLPPISCWNNATKSHKASSNVSSLDGTFVAQGTKN